MTHELISLPAHAVRTLLQDRQVSPLDLLDALEIRIGEVDPAVNALPTLCFERARARARERDFSTLPLAGMPIVIKDLLTVSGVRTTFGSMAYRDHVPQASDLLVERIEAAGGIVYAKSNTPEFGAGANTFNDVFGFTRNPWNTALSAAGSSGGSAVALATGMAWLATGSDLGGSLRNPASFCAVVGLRPSQGRVAADPGELAFNRLSMEGPMARNVTDAAMLLDVMAGYDSRDPMSLDDPSESFENAARQKTCPSGLPFHRILASPPLTPKSPASVSRPLSGLRNLVHVLKKRTRIFRTCRKYFRSIGHCRMPHHSAPNSRKTARCSSPRLSGMWKKGSP